MQPNKELPFKNHSYQMTEPKITVVGHYTKQESTFYNDHYVFTISTRKETTKSKPKFYLLFKLRGQRAYRYFSSLYPTNQESVYSAEYQWLNYQIKATDNNQVHIIGQ